MSKNQQLDTVTSEYGINFCVITGEPGSNRRFGICATMENDQNDTDSVENLFFSEEEAYECCKWLAENNVFPITLCEVLSNLYHLEIWYYAHILKDLSGFRSIKIIVRNLTNPFLFVIICL